MLICACTHFTFSLTSNFLNPTHRISHPIRQLYLCLCDHRKQHYYNATLSHMQNCRFSCALPLHPLPASPCSPPTPPLPIRSQRKNSGSSARIFLFYRIGLFYFLLMISKTFKRLLMYTQFPKAKTNSQILFTISRQTKFLIKDR